jgi:head-tail adaptor
VTLTSLLVHDVVILTAGSGTDRYGATVKDWATATSETVKGWVSQRSATEDHGNREAEVSDWVLYLHPGTDITAKNRVTWSGITFEVDGPPNPAWSPRGEHHLEVPLRVVAG